MGRVALVGVAFSTRNTAVIAPVLYKLSIPVGTRNLLCSAFQHVCMISTNLTNSKLVLLQDMGFF